MEVDQLENLKAAILRQRARLEEIILILSRPLPKGGSSQHQRNLIKEKLHLELAISNVKLVLDAEERRRAERLFRWQDMDQRVISPKTNELSEEMGERIRQAENRISFETARSMNSAAYLPRLLDLHEQTTDEWAGRLFAAYCQAWIEQNRPVSPAFIRAVSNRRIRELFTVRTSSVEQGIYDRARRINEPTNPFILTNWRMRMDRLANRWHKRLEAEAAKCEYNIARNVPYQIPNSWIFPPQNTVDEQAQRPVDKPPLPMVEKPKHRKTGRNRKVTIDFIAFAGGLWLEAKARGGGRVSEGRLAQIAARLDAKGYQPPAEFLEASYAKELKTYNSRNSNSKIGPITTWAQLVSRTDKDHLRGMRRRLSRCAEELDTGSAVRKLIPDKKSRPPKNL